MTKGSAQSGHRTRQYQVVGRKAPTAKDPEPEVFRMKLFSTNPVSAKSRFWYFMHQYQKMKKTTGEILSVNEVGQELFTSRWQRISSPRPGDLLCNRADRRRGSVASASLLVASSLVDTASSIGLRFAFINMRGCRIFVQRGFQEFGWSQVHAQ